LEAGASGRQAVEEAARFRCDLIELKRQRISAVLLDISLPPLDGAVVASWIRAQRRAAESALVAITGHAGAAERLWCHESGCTDYVDKPLRRQDLFAPLTRPHAGSGVYAAGVRLEEALAMAEEDFALVTGQFVSELGVPVALVSLVERASSSRPPGSVTPGHRPGGGGSETPAPRPGPLAR